MFKHLIVILLFCSSLASYGQERVTSYKYKVDTSITNKTANKSIYPSAVGGRYKDLADILQIYSDSLWAAMQDLEAGQIDSGLFATVSRLRDSMSVLRGLIANRVSYSDTSNLIPTQWWVDNKIFLGSVLKQDSVGSASVATAKYLTKYYADNHYLPIDATIEINGEEQNLADNPVFNIEIPTFDTSNIYAQLSLKQNKTDTNTYDATMHDLDSVRQVIEEWVLEKEYLDNIAEGWSTQVYLDTVNVDSNVLDGRYVNSVAIDGEYIVIDGVAYPIPCVCEIPEQVNLTAGTNITITGSYPNLTISSAGSGGVSTDTTSLSNRIDARVKYSDTAAMLAPYLRENDTTAMLATYLREADTASLSARIDARVKYTDTANMLAPYLREADTTAMLAPYASDASVALKANYTDTADMLQPYLRKVDTASLSTRINAKQNFTDTSTWDATRYWVQQQGYNTFTYQFGYGLTGSVIGSTVNVEVDTGTIRTVANSYNKQEVNDLIDGVSGGGTTPGLPDVLDVQSEATDADIFLNSSAGVYHGYHLRWSGGTKSSYIVANGTPLLRMWDSLTTKYSLITTGLLRTVSGTDTTNVYPNVITIGTDTVSTKAYVNTVAATKQPLDADLTAIAGLSPSNDDIIQRKSGNWVNRTMAQLKTDLAIVAANIPDFVSNVRTSISATGNEILYNSSTGVISKNKATQSLTDGATITFNVANGYNATVTLGGNRTLSITNMSDGEYYTLIVKQDGTGSRTLTLPASTKVIGGGTGAVTLTTTANAQDILTFFYSGTTLYCNYGKNYN